MSRTEIRIDSGVVIHGGVGTISQSRMTDPTREAYHEALRAALTAGHAALAGGGDAVSAVVSAVSVLEDSPLFNAGRGSNYDERGVITMDASLMRGIDREAGAVAGVTGVQNPIELARLVMERSEHLFLIGEGAEAFARTQGVEGVAASYFDTDRRREDLARARERAEARDRRPNVLGDEGSAATDKSGTVGAVALDGEGRLAAATSTGGMANKTWGRVGDTPLIGAGTFASELCAVSCTGWGEYFIRNAIAHDVHARMAYGGASLAKAVDGVIWGDTPSSGAPLGWPRRHRPGWPCRTLLQHAWHVPRLGRPIR